MTEDERQKLNDLRKEWFVLQNDVTDAYKEFNKRFQRLKNKMWRLFKKIDKEN